MRFWRAAKALEIFIWSNWALYRMNLEYIIIAVMLRLIASEERTGLFGGSPDAG